MTDLSQPILPGSGPNGVDGELRLFREAARSFIRGELVPRQERWRAQHGPDPKDWIDAGAIGLLLPDVPEDFGGAGGHFGHFAVVLEELAAAGVHFGCGIQGIVARYILCYGNDGQKRAWLPKLASGELIAAIAMSEPNAGSDLQAIRTTARREGEGDGAHYVISGQKTFISNARHAGLVLLAARTGGPGMKGLSMIVVETAGLAGYRAGRPLEKLGMTGQDTCEIFFDEAKVPVANLLGPAEGRGFSQMMAQLPYERLSIGVSAVATAERAVALTTAYVKERQAFGKSLFDLQNTRFKLAECHTEARIGRVFLDHCIERFIAGNLDEASTAMAKYWLTDRQCRIVDECLQLHGGYGYMTEYPIARLWADSRVQRIYAGSNEVMKEVIAWSL